MSSSRLGRSPLLLQCFVVKLLIFNNVQTRCIAKGEAQKSPLLWRFSGGFQFSQDRLFSRNSIRKPFKLIKSPIFTNTPCKSTCLYNAPSMHTVDIFIPSGASSIASASFSVVCLWLQASAAQPSCLCTGIAKGR